MCTRILYKNKFGQQMARNLDWEETADTKDKIVIFPKGIKRNGGTNINPLEWVSKYGSFSLSIYDFAVVDSTNEAGFGASLLALPGSDYGKRDASRKGLLSPMWVQFFADNFATVQEAIDYLNTHNIQVVTITLPGQVDPVGLHVSLQDKTGDSAILEYIDGELKIYHDPKYKVLTNQPSFDQQLENLKLYEGYGGNLPIPGSSDPKARFVRANYYPDRAINDKNLKYIEENYKMLFGFTANTAQMMVNLSNDPSAGQESSRTNYSMISNLTTLELRMYMTLYHSQVKFRLSEFDITENSYEWICDIRHYEYAGNIRDKFCIAETPFRFGIESDFTK